MIGAVMIDDQPVVAIHTFAKIQITHPRTILAQWAFLKVSVVPRLQFCGASEQVVRQPLQQVTGHKAVQIALVGNHHLRLGQIAHRRQANGRAPCRQPLFSFRPQTHRARSPVHEFI